MRLFHDTQATRNDVEQSMSARSSLAKNGRPPSLRRADTALKSPISKAGVLVIDVGGTSVKILATGQTESRSFRSGPKLTPRRMVSGVSKLAADWTYDAI